MWSKAHYSIAAEELILGLCSNPKKDTVLNALVPFSVLGMWAVWLSSTAASGSPGDLSQHVMCCSFYYQAFYSDHDRLRIDAETWIFSLLWCVSLVRKFQGLFSISASVRYAKMSLGDPRNLRNMSTVKWMLIVLVFA